MLSYDFEIIVHCFLLCSYRPQAFKARRLGMVQPEPCLSSRPDGLTSSCSF